MLNELIKLYKKCHYQKQSIILEITHDKMFDWTICIRHEDSATTIYSGNGDLDEQVCRAYLALKQWAIEEDLY